MTERFDRIFESDEGLEFAIEVVDVPKASGGCYRHHRLVVNKGLPGVVIVAESNAGILFVRSYRPSLGTQIWELPRGNSEPADSADSAESSRGFEDSVVAAGKRELAEETGYAAKQCCFIGSYVSDSSVFPQRVGVVVCRVEQPDSHGENDGEILEARWFSKEALDSSIASGEIHDAHSLAALAIWSTQKRVGSEPERL